MFFNDVEFVSFEEALCSSRRQMIERFAKHVSPIEARMLRHVNADKCYVKAHGMKLFDDAEKEYLDFTAGYGTLCLGHNPTEVLQAVEDAAELPTIYSFYTGTHPLIGALSENLYRILPGKLDISSFGNGGVESVEIALKTARAATGKKRFIYANNAYHGLSFAGLSISDATYKHYFEPLLEKCEKVGFGDLEALEAKLKQGNVAAFITEPIQCEAGCIIPPENYLAGAQELCKKYGALLIFDEIQTGFGRTGKMFAAQHQNVEPDIITLGKAFSAGIVPISVSATSMSIWKKAYNKKGAYDSLLSTFHGNPKACAAALKTIEIILREKLVDYAKQIGKYTLQQLQDLKQCNPNVKNVWGIGLLIAVEFYNVKDSIQTIRKMLNKHHIILNVYDYRADIIRIQPPLIVQRNEIDQMIEALYQVTTNQE